MRFLLTSGGVTNAGIERALVELLGKPVADSSALFVPTAGHPMSNGPEIARKAITGEFGNRFTELGWGTLGVLELTALPTIDRARWTGWLQDADALLVGGGDPWYLTHWLRESGVAELLPTLDTAVYVGLSAGSMVVGARVSSYFGNWPLPQGEPSALGLADFEMVPHLDHPQLPHNTMADAERWSGELTAPGYAVDDATALQLVDGEISVVSEGSWRLFP
jgi:dipeptidase E